MTEALQFVGDALALAGMAILGVAMIFALFGGLAFAWILVMEWLER